MAEKADTDTPQKLLARIYGVLVAALALFGFFVAEGHLFKLMNADTALDILRVPLALALLYAGFAARDNNFARGILLFTGILYVAMAVLGLINSTLWDLLPNGLTGFDILFHAATGVIAIGVARGTSERA